MNRPITAKTVQSILRFFNTIPSFHLLNLLFDGIDIIEPCQTSGRKKNAIGAYLGNAFGKAYSGLNFLPPMSPMPESEVGVIPN